MIKNINPNFIPHSKDLIEFIKGIYKFNLEFMKFYSNL